MEEAIYIYLNPEMLLWFCTVASGAGLTLDFDSEVSKRNLKLDHQMRKRPSKSSAPNVAT
jgi:hypothetical protein